DTNKDGDFKLNWKRVAIRSMFGLGFVDEGLIESLILMGITKLPGNLLDCLKCAEVVPNMMEKELLELDGKNLQIRQVGVNGDPPNPMLAGARATILWLLSMAASSDRKLLIRSRSIPATLRQHLLPDILF
ncbi:hypothetical protein DY000_02005113, partial [Brassica cretica]